MLHLLDKRPLWLEAQLHLGLEIEWYLCGERKLRQSKRLGGAQGHRERKQQQEGAVSLELNAEIDGR